MDASFLAARGAPQRGTPLVTCPFTWWRGWDLNPRPSGYEPDELPDCSTPRRTGQASRSPPGPNRVEACIATIRRSDGGQRPRRGDRSSPGPLRPALDGGAACGGG